MLLNLNGVVSRLSSSLTLYHQLKARPISDSSGSSIGDTNLSSSTGTIGSISLPSLSRNVTFHHNFTVNLVGEIKDGTYHSAQ